MTAVKHPEAGQRSATTRAYDSGGRRGDGAIVLFLPSLGGGGAERVMLNLARGFAERRGAVDLVLARAEGPYLDLVPPGVRVVDLGVGRLHAALPRLVRYLRHVRPVALLSTLTHANIAAILAARLAGVDTRVVVREANTLSLVSRRATTARDRVLPTLVRHSYNQAHAITCVSEGVARDLAATAGIPRERMRVLFSPIVPPEIDALAAEPPEHPGLLAGSAPVILSVGRLSPQKDYPTLIRAFATLRRRRPARLVILGDGQERGAIEALVAELGLGSDVALPGFATNPFAYMARATLFVLSSAWEGLPGALVQALACGATVVSTDCESGPREVLRDGRFGRLVPVGDVSALATAMDEALDAPRVRSPAEAWQPFTPAATVDAYLHLIGATVGAAHGATR